MIRTTKSPTFTVTGHTRRCSWNSQMIHAVWCRGKVLESDSASRFGAPPGDNLRHLQRTLSVLPAREHPPQIRSFSSSLFSSASLQGWFLHIGQDLLFATLWWCLGLFLCFGELVHRLPILVILCGLLRRGRPPPTIVLQELQHEFSLPLFLVDFFVFFVFTL
ncbi:hypothetical protein VTK56DRAFT_1510 [Thermocarpiscus australiensis]